MRGLYSRESRETGIPAHPWLNVHRSGKILTLKELFYSRPVTVNMMPSSCDPYKGSPFRPSSSSSSSGHPEKKFYFWPGCQLVIAKMEKANTRQWQRTKERVNWHNLYPCHVGEVKARFHQRRRRYRYRSFSKILFTLDKVTICLEISFLKTAALKTRMFHGQVGQKSRGGVNTLAYYSNSNLLQKIHLNLDKLSQTKLLREMFQPHEI